MSVYDPDAANLSAWGALVEKQSKGLKPDDFTSVSYTHLTLPTKA